MKFEPRSTVFKLRDVGSEVIDQLSTDVYTQPESVLREVIKNAYDAYLSIDADILVDAQVERQIVVNRERDAKNVGRLFITDFGIGQTWEELKANLQISISRKPEEVDYATGFRGLGSWALLGAGSRIVVTSRKYETDTGGPSRNKYSSHLQVDGPDDNARRHLE